MGQKLVQIDAFTDRPFAGNPAAVCLLEAPAEDAWMQQVAAEMNLSETAFLRRQKNGSASFELRWFTPRAEVDLCGHATLASAHFLWQDRHLEAGEPASFETRSGVLTCVRRADENGDWIEMDFPVQPAEPATAPSEIWKAIGGVPRWVGKNKSDYLIEVESEASLRELAPEMARLEAIPARGFIVTALASSESQQQGFDFVSRFFGPAVGVPEDPVTGSAHCALAPFWCERLDKAELVGYQASRRGGTVRVRWDGGGRVQLRGQAVTMLRAELV
jgi:PhzF family phenazine biosynthesis protein